MLLLYPFHAQVSKTTKGVLGVCLQASDRTKSHPLEAVYRQSSNSHQLTIKLAWIRCEIGKRNLQWCFCALTLQDSGGAS
jgi:hypothetical protein